MLAACYKTDHKISWRTCFQLCYKHLKAGLKVMRPTPAHITKNKTNHREVGSSLNLQPGYPTFIFQNVYLLGIEQTVVYLPQQQCSRVQNYL